MCIRDSPYGAGLFGHPVECFLFISVNYLLKFLIVFKMSKMASKVSNKTLQSSSSVISNVHEFIRQEAEAGEVLIDFKFHECVTQATGI